MSEEWRDIPGHDGYQVSSLGRVRSVDRESRYSDGRVGKWPGRILKQKTTATGYNQVLLSNGKCRSFQVHRLVAIAFHGPAPEGKPYVLHNDGTRNNNTPENLRWGDQQDNMDDMIRHRMERA